MADTITAEVTVTKVWPPKGKYFSFNCEQLKSEENKYGRVSGPVSLYDKIRENTTYRIKYHKTDEGYLNLDTLFTDTARKAPASTRPETPQKDSDRMGTMGMVNATLMGLAYACPNIDEFIDRNKGKVRVLIDFFSDELHATRMHGEEVQTSNDLNDQINF